MLAWYFSTRTAVLSFTELCFCWTVAYSKVLEPGGGVEVRLSTFCGTGGNRLCFFMFIFRLVARPSFVI